MPGTEAIWWINSALLALLTHAGLLWMLVVAEPDEANQPVETTIVIESLPATGIAAAPQKADEAKLVKDSAELTNVDEAETTGQNSSNESELLAIVKDDNEAFAPDDPLKRLNTSKSTGKAESVRATERTTELDGNDQRLSAADDTSNVNQTGKATNETEKPQSVPTPKSSDIAPDNSPSTAVLQSMSAKAEPTKTVSPKAMNRPVTTEPTPETTITTPLKNLVSPKKAERLSPAKSTVSKPVPPTRIAKVNDLERAPKSVNPEKQGPSTPKLQEVAVASPKRANQIAPDSRYRDLLRFLEQSEIEGCATILPTIAEDGSVSLSGFAMDENLWTRFQAGMTEELRVRLPLEAATVAKPQCRALTFARTLPDYPQFSLGMSLKNADLVSGNFLDGTITDIRNRHLHLVIVDDEGLVQQIDGFLQPKVSSATFSVPISVSGQAVRTAHMLIALAVQKPLDTVTSANETKAEQFFAAISEELAEKKLNADIAIVSFYLRSN